MITEKFWQNILLKLSFKPEKVRRAQAALLYVALTGVEFTADVIPDAICDDMTTAGCATKTLAQIGLIQYVRHVKSPAKSRHGAEVKQWKLADGKRETALTWLTRNGFPHPDQCCERDHDGNCDRHTTNIQGLLPAMA